ncbi:hypothetical protein D3OALGA1CA_5170 [Olavius algarvensis associated proteobacterium Delta 3]|nr:hypothetical protein D3OALGA1CA_5170 [Olavius algarvensis associated proteobacterium Delta 3]
MNRRTWFCLFLGTYAGCWILLLSYGMIGENEHLLRIADIFENDIVNFLFLTSLFFLIALVTAEAVELTHHGTRRLPPFGPRLGDVLIRYGYLTEEQLQEALDIQRMKLGEVLVESGHITRAQLTHALLDQQRNSHRKLGEVLRELGYATAQDIRWGLSRLNRKLGRILVEMGFLRNDDLKQVLIRMWHG